MTIPKDCPSLGPSNDKLPRGEWTLALEAQRIGHANERFHAASPARKRVILAKDVLAWLASAKLEAAGVSPGHPGALPGQEGASCYLRIKRTDPGDPPPGGIVNGDSCVACGIGALLAVTAERGGCALDRFDSDCGADIIHPLLSPYFSVEQLTLVEWAYEVGRGLRYHYMWSVAVEGKNRAVAFGSRFNTRATRLAAIMNNIIDNKGTFVP